MDLPKYRSHKTVQAAKIMAIEVGDGKTMNLALRVDDATVIVAVDILAYGKKLPPGGIALETAIGGYYVRYEDGYESWSPAAAFESGYTRLDTDSVTQAFRKDDDDGA